MTTSEEETGARSLGVLEAAVMEVVWARGPSTVRQVLDGLGREPRPAYTTVQTVMGRLVDKGLLERQRVGRTDVFRPTASREAFQGRVARAVVRNLFAAYGEVALAQFAAALEDADPGRLARLRRRFGEDAPSEETAAPKAVDRPEGGRGG